MWTSVVPAPKTIEQQRGNIEPGLDWRFEGGTPRHRAQAESLLKTLQSWGTFLEKGAKTGREAEWRTAQNADYADTGGSGARDGSRHTAGSQAIAVNLVDESASARSHVSSQSAQGGFSGYSIDVLQDSVIVRYSGDDALACALSCFGQAVLHALLQGAGLPCAHIADEAHWEWRGAMLDLSRHFFPVESIEHFIDLMWLFRLNRLHLHLTDDQGWRFSVPGFPDLVRVGAWRENDTAGFDPYGGSYSDEELRRINDYARVRGIVIVPEVDLPGHLSAAAAAYPHLICGKNPEGVRTRWGIFDEVLCAGRGSSYDFLETVLARIAELFPGPWIHIGGDEVPATGWTACPDCAELIRSESYSGAGDLLGHIMYRAASTVVALGKTPIVWDEALSGPLPGDTAVMVWRDHAILDEALRKGFDVIASPWTHGCYLDRKHLDSYAEPGRLGVTDVFESAGFLPQSTQSAGNAPQEQSDATILGGQANIWTEAIANERELEYLAFPRLCVIASNLWTGTAIREDRAFETLVGSAVVLLRAIGKTPYAGPVRAGVPA